MKLSNDPRLSEHPSHVGLHTAFDQLCGTCTAPIPPVTDPLSLIRLGWCKFLSEGVEVWICAGCWPTASATPKAEANYWERIAPSVITPEQLARTAESVRPPSAKGRRRMTLADQLDEYCDRAEDVNHPKGWLDYWGHAQVNAVRCASVLLRAYLDARANERPTTDTPYPYTVGELAVAAARCPDPYYADLMHLGGEYHQRVLHGNTRLESAAGGFVILCPCKRGYRLSSTRLCHYCEHDHFKKHALPVNDGKKDIQPSAADYAQGAR